MLSGGTQAGSYHGADHQRRDGLAAEHVTKLGGLIEDLVKAAPGKVDKHQFAYRTHALGGCPHSGADITYFGQGRVKYPTGKLRIQPFGDTQHAAPGILFAGRARAAGHVFANNEHAGIATHFLGQGFVDCLLVSNFSSHDDCPFVLVFRCVEARSKAGHG